MIRILKELKPDDRIQTIRVFVQEKPRYPTSHHNARCICASRCNAVRFCASAPLDSSMSQPTIIHIPRHLNHHSKRLLRTRLVLIGFLLQSPR